MLIFQDLRYGQTAFGKYRKGCSFRTQKMMFMSKKEGSRGWTDLEDELGAVGKLNSDQAM